jgi:transformation/transcription domain-associated protein
LSLVDLPSDLLCSCHQREWFKKSGGCVLISFLINHLPVQWVRTHEIEFINSLLFILRELSPSISLETVDKASASLLQVITVCHTPQNLAYASFFGLFCRHFVC